MESFLLQALQFLKFRTSPDFRIPQTKDKKWVFLWVFIEYKNGFSDRFQNCLEVDVISRVLVTVLKTVLFTLLILQSIEHAFVVYDDTAVIGKI